MWSLRNCRPTLCLPAIIAAMLAACGGGGGSDAVPTAGAPGRQERRRVHAHPGAQRQRGLARDHAHDLAVAERARERRPSRRQQVHRPDGGQPGRGIRRRHGRLAATKPRKGKKIDPNSAKVVSTPIPDPKRDDALAGVGGGGKKATATCYAFNGFAAELTRSAGREARQARRRPVGARTRCAARHVHHAQLPGPDRPDGFWERPSAGENVIIGIVDARHLAGAPELLRPHRHQRQRHPGGKLGYQQIPGWHGKCRPASSSTPADCNQKLIGARYYNAGWGGNAGITQLPYEFNSPRDYDGHGTHTASHGGRQQRRAGHGRRRGLRHDQRHRAAGPHRRLQGLLGTGRRPAAASHPTASRPSTRPSPTASTSSTTRSAARRPTSSTRSRSRSCSPPTRACSSPPRPATAARPHRRSRTPARGSPRWRPARTTATARLGHARQRRDLQRRLGRRESVGPAAFDRLDGRGGRRRQCRAGRLCYAAADNGGVAVLDPAKVAGKIVVCDRGVNARDQQEPGGPGGRRRRHGPGEHRAPTRSTPTSTPCRRCTCRAPTAPRVKAYAATAGATATISPATIVNDAPAPFTASFSSRGPLLAGRRRPPQAGHQRPRPGHPRRRGAARQRRPPVRLLSRHLDVQPARGRPRRRCSRSCTPTGRRWRSSRR